MNTNKTSFRDSAVKQQTSALRLASTLEEKRSTVTLTKYLSVQVLTLHVVTTGHTIQKLD
jgi:hypothetical protein